MNNRTQGSHLSSPGWFSTMTPVPSVMASLHKGVHVLVLSTLLLLITPEKESRTPSHTCMGYPSQTFFMS